MSPTSILGCFTGPVPRALRALLVMSLAASLGAGCFFGGEGGNKEGGSWDDFPNPAANTCGDITPAQMKRADSLMKLSDPGLAVA